MEKTIKSSAINNGLYLGITLALFTIIPYAINLALFTKLWLLILILVAIVLFGVISIKNSKKILGGFISFKNAFTSYFITIAIGLLISSLVYFLIFSVVDADAAKTVSELNIENQAEMMQNFGAPEEAIAETIEKLESQDQFSIVNQIKSYFMFLAFMSFIGLIVALIMKKNNPDTV